MAEAQSAPAKDTTFPIVVDVNTTQQVVVVDGKTFTINVQQSPITRAIGGNEEIYPRDPKATLSSVPVLVSKGKYKKYAVKQFTPFANLRGASYVLLRLDKFAFECKAPANTKTTAQRILSVDSW